MSYSQNCLSLFLILSTFIRVCVLAYVVEKLTSVCFSTVGVQIYVALKLKVNGRKIMLRKVMTGNLMKSHRLSETSDETKVFMCQSTECLA